ncbi:NTP transferase domain-containing protein [Veillonella sp. 3913]|uniref:NTP transferase domain-containing protein n=1 Tax=Veillonella sp. 3913 TaxID=2490952 RepID=UPI000F8EFADF|nr:NTP transferase domain-containing protein [Veillonella sp. 3913]
MITRNEFHGLLEKNQYEFLKEHRVDNAVIMAAGLSKRLAPVSAYCPKGLTLVKGEVLIERQIRQLQEAGITDIYVVVGYKKELFYYLQDKYNVKIVENNQYNSKDNPQSLYLVKDILRNTYICSVDNYYPKSLFNSHEYRGYYSSVHVKGETNEWCIASNEEGRITDVSIGGHDADIMLGHVYFDKTFSEQFVTLLEQLDDSSDYWHHVWEYLYIHHMDTLGLEIRKFDAQEILEFDSVDEAVAFDNEFLQHNSEEKCLGRQSE